MGKQRRFSLGWSIALMFLLLVSGSCSTGTLVQKESSGRAYSSPYTGKYLNRIAFPIGGIGAGMICLEGCGAISHVSVRNFMEFFNGNLAREAGKAVGWRGRFWRERYHLIPISPEPEALINRVDHIGNADLVR